MAMQKLPVIVKRKRPQQPAPPVRVTIRERKPWRSTLAARPAWQKSIVTKEERA